MHGPCSTLGKLLCPFNSRWGAICAGAQGSFLAQVRPTAAGQYRVSVLQAASDTVWLNFTAVVAAGSVLPAASYARGGGLFAGAVGQASNVTVSSALVSLLSLTSWQTLN